MNNSTKKAVFGIWATIIFSAILAIIDKWSGYIGDGEFMFIGNILMIPISIYIIYELFPSVKNKEKIC